METNLDVICRCIAIVTGVSEDVFRQTIAAAIMRGMPPGNLLAEAPDPEQMVAILLQDRAAIEQWAAAGIAQAQAYSNEQNARWN